MPFFLLLSMQAAGMVVDYFGAKNQEEMMKQGMQIKQASLEANIAQNNLEAEDASLQSMQQLRQNLGTQLAINAARGTASGQGSAYSIFNESLSNFNADQKTANMNRLGKENQLRSGAAISRLNYNSDTSALWRGFAQRTVNLFPSSISGWKQAYKDTRESFGLTSIGS